MYIDSKKLLNQMTRKDVIKIATYLGADRYEEYENRVVFPTICHNSLKSEKSMKLYYYDDLKSFRCFTECDCYFNIFELIKKVFALQGINYSFYEILQTTVRILGMENLDFQHEEYESEMLRYRKKKKDFSFPIYNSNILSALSNYKAVEWIEEGISEEVMEKYGIKFSIPKQKIIIPHYDVQGNLIGIRGRSLNPYEIEKGNKYMPFEFGGTMYAHQLTMNLYGLNFTKEAIKDSGIAILFEGEKSVLKLESLSKINNSAATCGSALNINQIQLLMKTCAPKEIVIAYDKEYEKNFTKESEKYFNKLHKIAKRYSNYCNFSIIFDMDNLLNKKDSPIDRGLSAYEILLNKRIQVK